MSPEEGSKAQRFLTVFGNVYAGWERLSIRTFFFLFFFLHFLGCCGECDSESCGFPFVLKEGAEL